MSVNRTAIGGGGNDSLDPQVNGVSLVQRYPKDSLKRTLQRFNANNLLGQGNNGITTQMTHNKLIVPVHRDRGSGSDIGKSTIEPSSSALVNERI